MTAWREPSNVSYIVHLSSATLFIMTLPRTDLSLKRKLKKKRLKQDQRKREKESSEVAPLKSSHNQRDSLKEKDARDRQKCTSVSRDLRSNTDSFSWVEPYLRRPMDSSWDKSYLYFLKPWINTSGYFVFYLFFFSLSPPPFLFSRIIYEDHIDSTHGINFWYK